MRSLQLLVVNSVAKSSTTICIGLKIFLFIVFCFFDFFVNGYQVHNVMGEAVGLNSFKIILPVPDGFDPYVFSGEVFLQKTKRAP